MSGLTYVRVNNRWLYVCFLVDLFNRVIIGYSAGPQKDAVLVYKAFASVKRDLRKVQLFHTDRGLEFKNEFTQGVNLDSLEQLSLELSDYVNWFSNIRIHSSLGYLSPVEYKFDTLKKCV